MQGMNDNASSTVALLELALNLGKYDVTNAVRFCFWAAEEHGLVGSYQYIKSLTALQRSKIALYLNFEMLASPNAGYFIFDPDCAQAENPATCPPPGVAHIRNTFQSYFTTYSGVTAQSHDMYGVSDYQNFLDVGIPSGYLTSGLGELITPAQATLYVFLRLLSLVVADTELKMGNYCWCSVRSMLPSRLRYGQQLEHGRAGHQREGRCTRSGDVCQLCVWPHHRLWQTDESLPEALLAPYQVPSLIRSSPSHVVNNTLQNAETPFHPCSFMLLFLFII